MLGCVIVSFLMIQAINFFQNPSGQKRFEKDWSTRNLDALKEKYQSLKEEDKARFKEAATGIYQGLGDAQKEDVKKYIQENSPESTPSRGQ